MILSFYLIFFFYSTISYLLNKKGLANIKYVENNLFN